MLANVNFVVKGTCYITSLKLASLTAYSNSDNLSALPLRIRAFNHTIKGNLYYVSIVTGYMYKLCIESSEK